MSVSTGRWLCKEGQNGVRINWWGGLPLVADFTLSTMTAGLNAQLAKALTGDDKASGLTAALANWLKRGDTREVAKLVERASTERYVEQVVSLEQKKVFRAKLSATFWKRFLTPDRSGSCLFLLMTWIAVCLRMQWPRSKRLNSFSTWRDVSLFLAWIGRSWNKVSVSATRSLVQQLRLIRGNILIKSYRSHFILALPLGPAPNLKHILTVSSTARSPSGAMQCLDLIRYGLAPANPRAT